MSENIEEKTAKEKVEVPEEKQIDTFTDENKPKAAHPIKSIKYEVCSGTIGSLAPEE